MEIGLIDNSGQPEYQRGQALTLAVQYATSRPRYNYIEVMEIAEAFLNWINDTVEGT